MRSGIHSNPYSHSFAYDKRSRRSKHAKLVHIKFLYESPTIERPRRTIVCVCVVSSRTYRRDCIITCRTKQRDKLHSAIRANSLPNSKAFLSLRRARSLSLLYFGQRCLGATASASQCAARFPKQSLLCRHTRPPIPLTVKLG